MPNIKIVSIIADVTSAQSFYRANLPLYEMSHTYPVDLVPIRGINWATAAAIDVAFFHMPTGTQDLLAAQVAKRNGKKVWVDFDDNGFALQADNPAVDYWKKANIEGIISGMAAIADIVTVSSEELANVYNRFRGVTEKSDCIVVPNALPDFLLPKRSARNSNGARTLLLRGGTSHTANFRQFTDPIMSALKSHPDWKIHFMGAYPVWMTDQLDKSQWSQQDPMDLVQYFEYLDYLQPAITMIPLANNPFNRGRSHNGWLEASFAHSKTLGPNFKEWERPGIVNYKDVTDFGNKLNSMMDNYSQEVDPSEGSWANVLENYLLSKTNKQRYEILQKLVPHKC